MVSKVHVLQWVPGGCSMGGRILIKTEAAGHVDGQNEKQKNDRANAVRHLRL